MPKIAYIERNIGAERLATIERANAIIAEYQQQGFTLTLRQLYYQFVARGMIPNRQTEYKRLGDVVNDGRLAGLIDWLAIEDRTRHLESVAHWNDPSEIVDAVARQYRTDKWAEQPVRVEVWIEKDALAGVFEGVCVELDVPYLSCRGYTSQSEMWGGAQRLRRYARGGQDVVVLHFGDHDPSGMDMSRDIEDRLRLFLRSDEGGLDVRRLALNMDQVEQFRPPPNPAKLSDSRSTVYIARYGDDSWELDALEPAYLAGLVRGAITGLRDEEKWRKAVKEEDAARKRLAAVSERWDEVETYLEDGG